MRISTTKTNTFTSLAAIALLATLPLTATAQRAFGRALGSGRAGHVTWSGTVDNTTIVTVHGGDVNTQVVSGKSSNDVNSRIVGRLPARPVRVFLRQSQGRGYIRIVQQPNRGNGFTARVRIQDPQGGSSFYHFVLAWRRAPRLGGGGLAAGGLGGF